MKRFVIATASALFVLAGSAAASVPTGTEPRLPRHNSFSPSVLGGPGVEATSLIFPGVDPGTPAPGAPEAPGSTPLLGAVDPVLSAVEPALSALPDALPAPVAGILSPVAEGPVPVPPPVPVPEVAPGEAEEESPADSTAPAPARRPATAHRLPGPAALQVAATDLFAGLPANGHAAYGTSSVIHTDLLQAGTQRLQNLDAAFSGATFTSAPIPEIKNEMARLVAPALGAGNGFGRGSGLEIGLGNDESGPSQVVPGSVAEAKSPPSTPLITTEVGPVSADPAVAARLLRGQAQSLANAACTPGVDLSYGLGYAADLGLVGTPSAPTLSTGAASPDRSVSQSRSHTFLVPQEDSTGPIRKFGLASETRQTIAPITFFKGQPQQFTLEFAGEWVLRTVADGKTAEVHYGPGDVTPETPLLRVLDKAGVPTRVLTTQELLGPTGLSIELPVAKITIGGPPRMIGGAADSTPVETPTLAAAAVDVVSVQLLDTDGLRLGDVRIGHMEAATAVPAGGIECGIGLLKKSDKEIVRPGESFTWTVTVTNPNDCILTNLKVVDTITATTGIVWTVNSAGPAADSMSNDGLTWNDVGPLGPGESKDLRINMSVAPNSGGGRFLDEAVATGVCGPAAGTADAAAGVPLEARVSLNVPEVAVAFGAMLPRVLPRTGGLLAILPALALTGAGLVLRRAKRRTA